MISADEIKLRREGKDANSFIVRSKMLENVIDLILDEHYNGEPIVIPIHPKLDLDVVGAVMERYRDEWSIEQDGDSYIFKEIE